MRRNLSLILFAAVIAGALELVAVLREPPSWVLVPGGWMGTPWVQHALLVLKRSAVWAWAVLWALLAARVVVATSAGDRRAADAVSTIALWSVAFFGGPLVLLRFFAVNAFIVFVSQSPFATAVVAALVAVPAQLIARGLFDRGAVPRSFAVTIPGTVFVLIATWVNRNYLPSLFAPVSLIVSAAIFTACAGVALLLLRLGHERVGRLWRPPGGKWAHPAVPGAVLVVVVAWAALPPVFGAGRASGMRNVILITIDTLRADHLTCYGHPYATTPALDRFASAGVLFTRCMSTAPMTVPSTLSILSSKYPAYHSIGTVNGHRTMSPEETTLATVLADRGYRTAAFVGNYLLRKKMGLHRGFDVYDDTFNSIEVMRKNPERTADKTTEYALNWLGSVGDESFFLWVHYQDPHGPYTPPDEYRERFEGPGLADDPAALEVIDSHVGDGGIPGYQYIRGVHEPAAYRQRYIGEVAFTDAMVGRLIDGLKTAGKWDNTVVVFTADHGEAMGEGNFWFCHGYDLVEELLHVPLIVRVPGAATGVRVGELTSGVDVMPTILSALELPPVDGMMGLDLMSLVNGGESLEREFVAAEDFHDRLRLQTPEVAYIVGPDGERLLSPGYTGEAVSIDDQAVLDFWLIASEEYKENADPLAGRTFEPTAEDLRKLKSLGYVGY